MLLIDTHIWLWLVLEPHRLRQVAARLDHALLAVSVVSCWEIAMLVRKGRVVLDDSPEVWMQKTLEAYSLKPLPLTLRIAAGSQALSDVAHLDPADQIIAATALEHRIPLVTRDRHLRRVSVIETIG